MFDLKCCICHRDMKKLHFPGISVLFPLSSNKLSYPVGSPPPWIEVPQPLCKYCRDSLKTWLSNQSVYTKYKKYKRRDR